MFSIRPEMFTFHIVILLDGGQKVNQVRSHVQILYKPIVCAFLVAIVVPTVNC